MHLEPCFSSVHLLQNWKSAHTHTHTHAHTHTHQLCRLKSCAAKHRRQRAAPAKGMRRTPPLCCQDSPEGPTLGRVHKDEAMRAHEVSLLDFHKVLLTATSVSTFAN